MTRMDTAVRTAPRQRVIVMTSVVLALSALSGCVSMRGATANDTRARFSFSRVDVLEEVPTDEGTVYNDKLRIAEVADENAALNLVNSPRRSTAVANAPDWLISSDQFGCTIQEEEDPMATFFFFGRYSGGAIKEIGPTRTKKAGEIFVKLGGKITSAYALLGNEDIVLIGELPAIEDALKASLSLAQLTGISFNTSPAVSIDDFDEIASKL